MALKGFHLYEIARLPGKGKVTTDRRRRYKVSDRSTYRRLLRSLLQNLRLPAAYRYAVSLHLASLDRNTSAIRVRNRCTLTGRGRGVFSKTRLSRHALRRLASRGHLPGFVKRH
uniref:Ribosomal protein S14 n=1 Tax=Prasinoderma coloniale TaxID=156133 RepID=V9PAP9_9VIRI|nr:ribosomal protein S14 [Prasinoderma coloniale]AGW52224.1 ribosomal protein S14 [Prasinoderma coloniale]